MFLIGRYASEGIKAACDSAYRGASEGSVLKGKENILFKKKKTELLLKKKKKSFQGLPLDKS